ncbi:hypothetical protein ACT80S_18550 [Ramlibacter sp. MAHUQ-53]|uniref:hypothetical protein n=1 Tax=unclassified Ramlibacter TaxID=2617605 RepID=UPI00362D674B
MTISTLPTAPQPTDTQEQFNTKAFALVAALDGFVTEANALAAGANTDAATATTQAATATTQAGTATTQAGIATTQAGIATTKAGEAEASAAAALASKNAAATSESNAAASQSAAASSAAAAAAAVAGLGYSDVVFINAAASPYTVSQATSGKLIACDTSAGAITINLPVLGPLTKPYVVGVKKTTSDANGVTVVCGGTDVFDDGTASKSISVPAGLTLIPDVDASPDAWVAIGFGGATAGPATGSGLTMGSGKLLGRNTAGSGAIEEIPQASQAEMEAGSQTALRGMSPQNIAQAIAALTTPSNHLPVLALGIV